jgi:peptidoglycan/LPS O-acetylase OafA/YrhL
VAEPRYYPYFDYLRAFAALGVFVAHADKYHYLPPQLQLGNACVQLFFTLSGFLIGGILLRSHPMDLPRFYFNRAARIWIPYAIAIALLALATALKQGFHDPKFGEFFIYMGTFVYNWFGPPQLAASQSRMPLDGTGNHFWSICVEEQFYLVAPFLILFTPRIVLAAGLVAATLFSPLYFLSISLGVALALVGPRAWLIAVSASAGVVLVIAGGPYIAASATLSLAIVCIFARLPGSATTFGRIVGGASYPFYLNHWIGLFAINAAMHLKAPYWMAWITGLLIAVALSVLHFIFIDRTIAAKRDKWFSPRTGYVLCTSGVLLVAAGMIYGLKND